jgi:AcrR family transcriptional regulator
MSESKRDEPAVAVGAVATETANRPLRADAVKNRQRLLEAAEDVFATDGVQAQVDLIAERAGLGVGTLYRHFPTKESLIEAIIRARLEALSDRAAAFAADPDRGGAFFSFLHEFALQAAAKRDLFESLGAAGVNIKANCADTYEVLQERIGTLLRLAQAEGSVRADIGAEDVIGLVAGTCQAVSGPGRNSEWISRMMDVVCDGLQRHSTSAP